MKANEIMLGDWVQVYNGRGEHITDTRIDIHILYTFCQEGQKVLCLKPIPLTSEILEKNFTRTEVRVLIGTKTHYIENDDFFDVALNEYTDSIWEFEYSNCESNFPIVRMFVTHVHELQHALKLCGINKTIEL